MISLDFDVAVQVVVGRNDQIEQARNVVLEAVVAHRLGVGRARIDQNRALGAEFRNVLVLLVLRERQVERLAKLRLFVAQIGRLVGKRNQTNATARNITKTQMKALAWKVSETSPLGTLFVCRT